MFQDCLLKKGTLLMENRVSQVDDITQLLPFLHWMILLETDKKAQVHQIDYVLFCILYESECLNI